MKKYFLLIAIALLLAACAPSETSIQTAIAETRIAQPTITYTPTFIPTSTPIPSQTPSPTPSPTPDIRVIDVDPHTLLLTKADLPTDAGYYLPGPDWISPHLNSEVVAGWGVAEGQIYIERTGRIMGWWVYYNRGSSVVIAPQEIYDNVVLYKTNEGAMVTLDEFSDCNDPELGYTIVEPAPVIGDASVACVNRIMQSSGEYKIYYSLSFVYRNIYHNLSGWGWEREVRYDYVDQIAETLLSKLKAAPLTERVTFTP